MRPRSISRGVHIHEWICRRERIALNRSAGASTAAEYVAWRDRSIRWGKLASICIQTLGGAQ